MNNTLKVMLIYSYAHYKKYPNVLEVFFYFDLLHHCKIISFHFVRMNELMQLLHIIDEPLYEAH